MKPMTGTNRLAALGLGLALAAGCPNQGRSLVVQTTEAGVIDAAVDSSPVAADAYYFGFPDAAPPPDLLIGPDSLAPHCWQGFPGNPFVVCFGEDPVPYAQYLRPRDGGYVEGQCPSVNDFYPSPQGEACYWIGCGPADPSARDAGAGADLGAGACCFWVDRACGV